MAQQKFKKLMAASGSLSATQGTTDIISGTGAAGNALRKIESKKEYDQRFIPLEQLQPSTMNTYPIEDIEKLKESITTYGLHENLVVIPDKESDKYIILAGERRYTAIKELQEEGVNILLNGVPCKVLPSNTDTATQEIILIEANELSRTQDAARRRKMLARLEELYTMKNQETIKENPDAAPEDLIDVKAEVAEKAGISERQLQKYSNVNHSLIPELQEYFDANKISLTSADMYARLDEDVQRAVLTLLEDGSAVTKGKLDLLNQQVQEQKEALASKNAEYEAMAEKLEHAEATIQQNQVDENALRQEIEAEYASQTPDEDKLEELQSQLELTQRAKEKLEKQYADSEAKTKELQKELEKAQETTLPAAVPAELDAETEKLLSLKYEIETLVSACNKSINNLTKKYSEYQDLCTDEMDMDKFVKTLEKALHFFA